MKPLSAAIRIAIAIVFSAGAGGAASVLAQSPPDEMAVLQAALSHVRASLPAGTVMFDPRVPPVRAVDGTWKAAERSAADAAALARALGGVAGSIEVARICERTEPSACRLDGVGSIVAAAQPRISGDTAEVVIMLWYRTASSRQPIASKDLLVKLSRKTGRWMVESQTPIRMS